MEKYTLWMNQVNIDRKFKYLIICYDQNTSNYLRPHWRYDNIKSDLKINGDLFISEFQSDDEAVKELETINKCKAVSVNNGYGFIKSEW